MTPATSEGIYVTIVGMSLLFLALAVLMVFIRLLARFFPVRAEPAAEPEATAPAPAPNAVDAGPRVAAIAVALALAQRRRRAAPLPMPAEGATTGAWVVLGRQAQMASRRQ